MYSLSNPIRFNSSKESNGFYLTLRKRVDEYFSSQKLNKYGNSKMWFKTLAILSIYFVPYSALFIFPTLPLLVYYLLWIIMGVGMAGIGLSIMHDANHGSYFKNQKLNSALGEIIALVGGHSTNWKIQHNVLHHTYTNVHDIDEDIDIGVLMRFSPHQERLKIHRFQHIYAWFLYALMTIMWMTTKDFKQLLRYHKADLLRGQHTSLPKEFVKLTLFRLVYFFYALFLPLYFSSFAWWEILIGFFSMHFIAGFILSCVFQSAHVMETSPYEEAKDNVIQKNWAIHQLLNTANFAMKSRFLSWYAGGLNFQIEHHLFPNICHIHYKKLSEIVQKTAQEFNLPYYHNYTFWDALRVHYKTLKQLGRADTLPTYVLR